MEVFDDTSFGCHLVGNIGVFSDGLDEFVVHVAAGDRFVGVAHW